MIATDMGLGGCAVGSTNIDLFAKMTGIDFHVEGPVGRFARWSRHHVKDRRLSSWCLTSTIAAPACPKDHAMRRA